MLSGVSVGPQADAAFSRNFHLRAPSLHPSAASPACHCKTVKSNTPLFRSFPALAAGLFALIPTPAGGQNFPLNLPPGVSEISRNVYDLHMLIFYICCAIGVLVFGVLLYSLIAHRRSRRPQASRFSESLGAEIGWTLVPFIILVVMAVPAARTLVAMEKPGDYDMTVKITGYQWKWHYEYLDQDLSFFSSLHPEHNKARQLGSGVDVNKIANYLLEVDNPLVLPVDKRVRFLLTSNDVIHSWWLIDLAVKKDAVPGLYQRDLGHHRGTGHLSRQMRRTLRARPRFYADQGCGRGR